MTTSQQGIDSSSQVPAPMTERMWRRAMHSAKLVLLVTMAWLEIPYMALVPEPTREALADVATELRSSPVAFDLDFWARHLRLLRPSSIQGWMGLAASVVLGVSFLSGLACVCAVSTIVITYISVIGAIAGGIFVIVSSVSMLVLFVITAAMTGAIGSTLAAGYIALRFCNLAMPSGTKQTHFA